MYEVFYNVQNFPYRKGAWTFSFGDNTGTGFHADYAAGWDTKVLQQAIDQCVNTGTIETCPPLAKSINENVARACRITAPGTCGSYGHHHTAEDSSVKS